MSDARTTVADETTAIRHPGRGRAHRVDWARYTFLADGSPAPAPTTRCGLKTRAMTERVPLSQTAPEDRCRTCWPTPKETP